MKKATVTKCKSKFSLSLKSFIFSIKDAGTMVNDIHCVELIYVVSFVMVNISRELEQTSSTKTTTASQMDSTVVVNLLTTWDDQILGFIENTNVNHECFLSD